MRFILIDKIHELEPGQRLRASKTLSASEEIFLDHFPGFPVVPGVLLTEMMAQAAGKCLDSEGSHSGRAMLAQIKSAAFRKWVKPDEEAVIHATIAQSRETYATANCFIEVNGERVCSAELFFAFAPWDEFEQESKDAVLETYWAEHPQARPKAL